MGAANGVAAIQAPANKAAPFFSFGVIADVQYADIPDGRSFYGVPRYYRHSLAVLRRAVTSWNNTQTQPGGVSFCINFGDIVDRHCPKDKSLSAVREVLDAFGELAGGRPTYHMLGNHCLYNLPQSSSSTRTTSARWAGPRTTRQPRRHCGSSKRTTPTPTRTAPTGSPAPPGASWRTTAASARGEKVVVCGHLPMDPGAAFPESLLWNYNEVMGVVHRYGCVKACFAGHDHQGGYCVDSHGVHHRALEAALECPPGTSAFGRVEVYRDRLVLVGSDRMANTEMRF
ncbi:hypothetical protein QOZ80_6AG0525580 [Eleusine coracana subsp. coracana]|nr:hypothetical protein QOZ80_6AG0525580 [Eleusine coracana subsp. coracana]